jgi:hypothetical protein
MNRLDQRYVIKFLWESGKAADAIHLTLQEHYDKDAYCERTVYRWVQALKLGRTNLSNIPSPGRTPDELLPAHIQQAMMADPYISATKVAHALNVSPSTVCRYLHEVLQKKFLHLRWVPHTLDSCQKATRAETAQRMLVELRKHARSNFHFLFTGDETWVFYENPNTHMWVADIGELDEVQRKSHHAKKVMATVFFNESGQFVVDMMPAGQTMNSTYFATRIIPKLAKLCYHSGRRPHQRRFTAHFDNAPSHCT